MAPKKKDSFGFNLPSSNIFGGAKKNPFGSNLPRSGIFGSQEKNERDSRRSFTSSQKKEILGNQNNKCDNCSKKLDPRDIHYHHKKPWADGGKTIVSNGRAVCGSCHNKLSHKDTLKKVDKKRKRDNGSFGNWKF